VIKTKFSKSITDIVKERTSWRTYSTNPLGNDTKEKLLKILELNEVKSPFNDLAGKYRFEFIHMPDIDPEERKKLGTYGFIKGAQSFIVGVCDKSDYDKENFGYLMEAIILAATDLGLGTCWLGGFFKKSEFSEKVNRGTNEDVPAITPIGYPANKRRLKERVLRGFVRANARQPWDKMFFEGDFSTPLRQDRIGDYATLIEMVRLGPSAGNKQPWRIVKEEGKNIFHFYVVQIPGKEGLYTRMRKIEGLYTRMRKIDIGIAVCHFDLTAKELDIKGTWEFSEPNIEAAEVKYVISWKDLS